MELAVVVDRNGVPEVIRFDKAAIGDSASNFPLILGNLIEGARWFHYSK